MTDQDHREHDVALARQILAEHGKSERREEGLNQFVDQFVLLPVIATIIVFVLIAWLA